MKKKNLLQTTKGFSLVELLVVATIIGLLAAAGIVSYTTANRTARDAKRKADLEKVRAALELYRIEEGCYPGSSSAPCTASMGSSFSSVVSELNSAAGSGNQYLSNTTEIKDPRPSPNPQYTFTYGGGTDCSIYCLCAGAETESAANSTDSSCSFTAPGDKTHYCVCNP